MRHAPDGAATGPPPTVVATLLQGHLVFVLRYGLRPEELCRLTGISPAALLDGTRRVPTTWLDAFWRTMVDQLPHVDVGFEIGRFWTPDRLAHGGEMARHASSVRHLLEMVAWATPIMDTTFVMSPVRVEVDAQNVQVVIPDVIGSKVWQRTEAFAVQLLACARLLSDEPVAARRVEFTYPSPRSAQRCREFFGCEVHFERPRNLICFDRQVAERPLPGGSPAQVARYAAFLRDGFEPAFLHEVRGVVAAQLEVGAPSQSDAARRLGTSVRSLQRKLDAAGVQYRELVAAQRKATALRILSRPDTTVADAAYATGYEDAASFSRAFRRWTGLSPSEYRVRDLGSER